MLDRVVTGVSKGSLPESLTKALARGTTETWGLTAKRRLLSRIVDVRDESDSDCDLGCVVYGSTASQ